MKADNKLAVLLTEQGMLHGSGLATSTLLLSIWHYSMSLHFWTGHSK